LTDRERRIALERIDLVRQFPWMYRPASAAVSETCVTLSLNRAGLSTTVWRKTA
jgi:hypothetical protein